MVLAVQTFLTLLETLGMGVVFLVLLASGIAKMFSLETFRVGLLAIPYMKPPFTYPIAYLLPFLELLAAMGIWVGSYQAKWLALILFVSFQVVIAVTLLHKLKVDCHCFGSFGNRKLSMGTFLTNLILMAFILLDLGKDGLFLDIVGVLSSLALALVWLLFEVISKNQKLILENYAGGLQ